MKTSSIFSEDHPLYPLIISSNVILTTLLAIISAVSTMIADPAIQGELALSYTEAIWITTLYLLGINLTVPTSSWFASQFGFKRVYTYGVLIFITGTLIAYFSMNFFSIAFARLIEGIGAGFIFPVGLALIVQSLPKAKTDLGINLYVGIAFGGGLSLGITLSGFLTQFASWREIFLLIFSAGLLSALSCWLTRSKHPPTEKKTFDLWGFSFFALFISTLLVALTLGPIRSTNEGWYTPYIIFCFLMAIGAFICFIFIEAKHPNPLFPLSLFKDPIFSVSLAAMFLLGMATFASVSISIQYMLNGLLYEKYVTAKIAAIYGVTIGIVSMLSNFLSKFFPTPVLTFSGLSLLIFSYFYNNELSILTGYSQIIFILVIRGVGIGLSLGSTTLLALKNISPEKKSSAATILTFFRQVGGTYGGTLIAIVSIRQTIFHKARFSEQVNKELPAYKQTFQNILNKYPDAKEAKLAIVQNIEKQAYIQGLNDALILFGYVTLFVGLILILTIGYKTHQMRLKNDQ